MTKNKLAIWLTRLLALAILIGTAIWTIQNIGIISWTETEIIYWERARFLLGQGGASFYSGSSLCSLGYSFVLLPICALIESPYAAYKAAILLNGLFLCGAYLAAIAASKRIFKEESAWSLSVGCFFAVFCPALFVVRIYTGPEMLVLFLTWVCIYLLGRLWEKGKGTDVFFLVLCLCLIGFLQISALGMIIAMMVLLGIYVRKGRITETSFLYAVLALLIVLAAENIAERVLLGFFVRDMDITTIDSSLEVLLDGITALTETGYLSSLISSLAGKLYSVAVASFLLIGPALWRFGRSLVRGRRTVAGEGNSDKEKIDKEKTDRRSGCMEPKKEDDTLFTGIVGIFLFQLLWMALYDNSRSVDTGLLSLSGLEMVLSPVFLLGIMQMKKMKFGAEEFAAQLLVFCVCVYITADAVQASGITSVKSMNCGFLNVLQNSGDALKPVAVVYMAACLAIFVGILVTAIFSRPDADAGKKKDYAVVRFIGGAASAVALCVLNLLSVQTAEVNADNNMTRIAPVASLISETDTESECVYFVGTGGSSGIAVLQSLLPERQIRLIANNSEDRESFFDELEQDEKDYLLLTGTGTDYTDGTFAESLEGYEIVYMTGSYAIWAQSGSELLDELEERTEARVEELTLNEDATDAAEEALEEEETETETEEDGENADEADTEAVDDGADRADEDEDADTEDVEAGIAEADDVEARDAETEDVSAEDLEAEDAETEDTEADDAENASTDDALIDEAEDSLVNDVERNADDEAVTETVLTEEEDEEGVIVYGGSTHLSSGTYQMEIHIHTDSEEELDGTITVSDSASEISVEAIDELSVDENGDSILTLTFSSADIMRSVKVTLQGSFVFESDVEQILYWKVSPYYSVMANDSDVIESFSALIRKVDKKCKSKGTVTYAESTADSVDEFTMNSFEEYLSGYDLDVITQDELEDLNSEYLIAEFSSFAYYSVMDRYSIIDVEGDYVLLALNDSVQYQRYVARGGTVYSSGTEIFIPAFGVEDVTEPVEIRSGYYSYHVILTYDIADMEGEASEIAGYVYVMSGTDTSSGRPVTYGELQSSAEGELELSVPVYLRFDSVSFTCRVEMEDAETEVELTPVSIELLAQKYPYGKEIGTEVFSEFTSIVNLLGEGTKVSVVQSDSTIDNQSADYEWLQEQMPQSQIAEVSYADAISSTEDQFLLTCELRAEMFELLKEYSILDHIQGQYTLWVKNDGEYLRELLESGVTVLSSSSGMSISSIAAMSTSAENEETIYYLPPGNYKIKAELNVSRLKEDDTIEVLLLRDKTEEEIAEEVNDLVDMGFTRKEALELVDAQEECGTVSYTSEQLLETDGQLIEVSASFSEGGTNLTIAVDSQLGSKVDAKMIWIGLA